MALIISGQIVPMDGNDPDAVFKGRVFIDDNGNVERVTKGDAPAPTGFTNARKTNAGNHFVLPGFIDLHNHIAYNALPLWSEPKQKVPFAHHDSWPRAASYRTSITFPAKALAKAAPDALLAYVQLRALVGGATAIQGWPAANRPMLQALRNVDDEKAGTSDRNLIKTSALTLLPAELAKAAQGERQGRGFIYHCAEGSRNSIVEREFTDAAQAGCLDRTFVGVHLSAISGAEWDAWDKTKAGTVAWSPFSNLWLYQQTTDIAAAKSRGVAICLGSDWGPSGTKNILGEIKVARMASQKLDLGLTDRELVAMITSNPGDALARCWKKTVGRLTTGAFGDVTIVRAKGNRPVWTQIVEATEADVMLAVFGGLARYGDDALMKTSAGTAFASITVAKRKRGFAIPNPKSPATAWKFTDIAADIDRVRKNPKKAIEDADARRRAFAGPMDATDAPLDLVLDMPSGTFAFAGDIKDHADEVVIPPLPTLVHDASFFNDIARGGQHGGALNGLAAFYS